MENPNYEKYTGEYRHNKYKYLSDMVDEVSHFLLTNLSQKQGEAWVSKTYQTIMEDIEIAKRDQHLYITKKIGNHIAPIIDEDIQLNPFHKDLLARIRAKSYSIQMLPDPKPRAVPLSHDVIIRISR